MTLVTDQTMTEAPWGTVTTSKEGVFSIFFLFETIKISILKFVVALTNSEEFQMKKTLLIVVKKQLYNTIAAAVVVGFFLSVMHSIPVIKGLRAEMGDETGFRHCP